MKANNVLLIEADMLWVRLINKIIERDPSIRITHIPRPERDVPFDAALHGRGVDIVIFDPSQTSEEERGWFYKKLNEELGDTLVISHSALAIDRISGIAAVNHCPIDRHVEKPRDLDDLAFGLRHLREKLIPLFSTPAENGNPFRRMPTASNFKRAASGLVPSLEQSHQASNTFKAKQRTSSTKTPTLTSVSKPVTAPKVAPTPISSPARTQPAKAASSAPRPRKALRKRKKIELIVIGSSTGGPKALAGIIPLLAASFPVPILIAQHMPEKFTELLAQQLDKKSALTVREARSNVLIKPGEVWIAPGDRHLMVRAAPDGLLLKLEDSPPVNACRPAIDLLFHSAAKICGENTLAIALTGMGHDGRDGGKAINLAGGQIIAQDEASSVVWGIPGAIVNAGIADEVLPLDQIAGRMTSMVQPGALITQNGTENVLAPRR